MLQFKNDSCCKILAKAFIVFWNSSVSLTQQLIITYFRLPKLASCTLFSYAPRFQEAKKKPKVSSIKADTDRVVRVRLTAGNNPCPDDQKNLSSSAARYTQVQHQRWMINVHSSVHWFIHHILTFIYSANPWGEVMTRRALLTVPNEMAWSFFFDGTVWFKFGSLKLESCVLETCPKCCTLSGVKIFNFCLTLTWLFFPQLSPSRFR